MSYFTALGAQLSAESCTIKGCAHHKASEDYQAMDADQRDLALLRSMHRAGLALSDELSAYLGRTARMDQLASLLMGLPSVNRRQCTSSLRTAIAQTDINDDVVASLFDVATEGGFVPLDVGRVTEVVRATANGRVRRAAIRYLSVIPLRQRSDALLTLGSHITDEYEQLTWALAARLAGISLGDIVTVAPNLPHDIISLVRVTQSRELARTTLMQFALWGSLDRPGEANSGGLGVFLTSLGDALAVQRNIDGVITVTLGDPWDIRRNGTWLVRRSTGHQVLSLPMPTQIGDLSASYSELSWWLRSLIAAHHLQPQVSHLRFSDDATLAVGRVMRDIGAKITYTIAPDPHRMALYRSHSSTGHLDTDGLANDLHRLFIADVLSEWADGAVAISAPEQESESRKYFPQLLRRLQPMQVKAIPEGITTWKPLDSDDAAGRQLVERLFQAAAPFGLTNHLTGSTVLLNVGQWNAIKQQDVLVEAWLASGAYKKTTLVLIGGSDLRPTSVELDMRERIAISVKSVPDAAGRLAWLPHLRNREVRLLERALQRLLPGTGPHVYLCASQKEEFGIAVLEAMDAGMLCMAPRRGACGHYIHHGKTGFLIDTSSAQAIAADLGLLLNAKMSQKHLASIARAGRSLVRGQLGIERVAQQFSDHYAGLTATPNRDVP